MVFVIIRLKTYIPKSALSANPPKWSNTLKTIRQQQPRSYVSVFDHFARLALKGLMFHLLESQYIAFH